MALPVPPPDANSRSLLRGGARALHVDGDLQASRAWFDAAYRAAEAEDNCEAMAEAALGLGGLWVHEHRNVGAAVLVEARQRRALSLVDPRSSLALRLRARLAGEADYRTGNHTTILAITEEARTSPDPIARAETTNLAHHCLLGPDHATQRHHLAQQLIAESFHTTRRSDLLMGILWRTVNLILTADPHAPRGLTELRTHLTTHHHLATTYVLQAIDVMHHIRAGHFTQAETHATTTAQRGHTAGDADATGWYGAHLVAIRWYQGRITELLPTLHDLVNSPTLSAIDNSSLAALAIAAATTGDHRQATSALARLHGTNLTHLPKSSSWLISLYGAIETAHLLHDQHTAHTAYQLLQPHAHLPMIASLGIACFGSTHHALGIAALTQNHTDQAIHHLRTAIHDNLALEHWPAATLSRWRLAQALTTRNHPGDTTEADQHRHTAQHEATTLGMILPGTARTEVYVAGPSEPTRTVVVSQRQGRQWRIELGHRAVLVEHSRGMQYLAILLANPGHEIAAAELAAGPGLSADAAANSTQPVLDDVAKREYRQRLAKLQAEIDEYEAREDTPRADKARAERDWLLAELTAAAGLGGRARQFSNSEERARIAVGKAIRRALDRITASDTAIGEELRATIQTGLRCCYRPR